MERKKQIRREMIVARNQLLELNGFQNSKDITQHLFQLKEYQEATQLLLYIDYNREVSTKDIFLSGIQEGKQIYCPKITGNEMKFYKVEQLDQLERGYQGILEPIGLVGWCYRKTEKPIAIVPGVAFDYDNNRLGYGKGFYDRFLSENQQVKTIGLAHHIQILNQIPVDNYDKPVDILITEKGIV